VNLSFFICIEIISSKTTTTAIVVKQVYNQTANSIHNSELYLLRYKMFVKLSESTFLIHISKQY